jgi:hypothetical protein
MPLRMRRRINRRLNPNGRRRKNNRLKNIERLVVVLHYLWRGDAAGCRAHVLKAGMTSSA